MDDCLTDFMCEPAEMDGWLSTAHTSHSGKLGRRGGAPHDPHGLVGSGQGQGFGDAGNAGSSGTDRAGAACVILYQCDVTPAADVCLMWRLLMSWRAEQGELAPLWTQLHVGRAQPARSGCLSSFASRGSCVHRWLF